MDNYEKMPDCDGKSLNRYPGRTSYYAELQDIIDKVIRLISAKKVLELGSAFGATVLKLSEIHPDTQFIGIDSLPEAIELAREIAGEQQNVFFLSEDMQDTVRKRLNDYDLIYLMYSFCLIPDPLRAKVEFLRNCYANMKKDAYLLIAETFLPEDMDGMKEENEILKLWRLRGEEGYASVYWSALNDISTEGLKAAKCAASAAMNEEIRTGNSVYWRNAKFPVKLSWLRDTVRIIGFKIVIEEPVNCLSEKVILLKKL